MRCPATVGPVPARPSHPGLRAASPRRFRDGCGRRTQCLRYGEACTARRDLGGDGHRLGAALLGACGSSPSSGAPSEGDGGGPGAVSQGDPVRAAGARRKRRIERIGHLQLRPAPARARPHAATGAPRSAATPRAPPQRGRVAAASARSSKTPAASTRRRRSSFNRAAAPIPHSSGSTRTTARCSLAGW